MDNIKLLQNEIDNLIIEINTYNEMRIEFNLNVSRARDHDINNEPLNNKLKILIYKMCKIINLKSNIIKKYENSINNNNLNFYKHFNLKF